MERQELWQATLAKIELTLSRPSFLTWFQGTGIASIENGVATVAVPNGFAKEWLRNKYHKPILHALREISSDIKDVSYIIGRVNGAEESSGKRDTPKRRHSVSIVPMGDESYIRELTIDPETCLNPRYTFDSFVVGSFNELAHAAAQSVLKSPGTSYNPLFIYGGVGLGKTHLIQAVGNAALKQNPNCKVRYIPSEKFMIEIVEALKNQEINKLKDKYRAIDMLIMDDIQFMARTEKMQEEFFHTFNALYEKNKQIILSSDRPPQAIATLEERLRSRFEGGMIADIGVPDFETRLTILKTKAESKSTTITEEVLRYLAETIKNNIRELEGSLNRVAMASRISRSPISLEEVKKIVSQHINAPKRFLSPKKILKAVAEFYDIEERDLIQRSRKKDYVRPRQIAMYLMREELKISYPSIGDRFGGRDHTTAIHSCEKVGGELKTNPELEEEIRAVKDRMLLG
ncbi:MAG: chromosomal replication initiator protein DnaA [Candidatus Sungiibacteriota bacterium]|uniref:Chromosomal replication initiator protein DnaA n=1 Tax=Candidatus Sungiibacteriota bacterium TaxID=2750080 RepID=A0A7T5RIQ3_9BACT|nr:MAG: chromosomal replication initiator protein DnaA [Candidatus Sungbacteria bacterium]